MAAPEQCFIGIDVAKDWLDVATHPAGETWRVPHTREAVAALVLRLLALDPALITLEASGGYEALATALLGEAGLPVAVVNPRPVRDFARSQGILAKTDRLDALVIARYGQVAAVTPQPPTAEGDRDLAALTARRRQVVQMRTAELQRRHMARSVIVTRIERMVAVLNAELADLDREITRRVGQSPHWQQREQLLRTVPGVGPILSLTLLADLPELGALDKKAIAALVGLAPLAHDSGRRHGPRSCWGGRAHVRTALSMPTVAALRANPVIRAFYDRLVAQGKPKKVALVACMHKLLTILNAIVRHQTPWNPHPLAIHNSC